MQLAAKTDANLPFSFETANLVLRELTPSDVPTLSRIAQAPLLWQFLILDTADPGTLGTQLLSRVSLSPGYSYDRLSYTFSIFDRSGVEPIGMVSVTRETDTPRATLGDLFIDPSAYSRQYGTEAARGAIAFAFALPGVVRLWALRHHLNTAGERSFAAGGFSNEGLLRKWLNVRGEPTDFYVHSIVDSEWQPTPIEVSIHKAIGTQIVQIVK